MLLKVFREYFILIVFVIAISINPCIGQDIQFSQFYSNVLYLNPAFAGSAHGLRGIAHQRLQWPALEAKYLSSMVSADYYLKASKSGIGLMFLRDMQGAGIISTTELALQYAQEVNLSSKYSVRAGAQLNFVNRYINYSKLTFPDQFNNDGFASPASNESFGSNKITYGDFALGGMLYSDRFWFGASTFHLNTPNQSFTGEVSSLPVKYDFITGYKFIIRQTELKDGTDVDEIFVSPTIHYKMQGKSDQLDLGVYAFYNQLMAGLWYRGLPIKHYKAGLQNNESIVCVLGWKFRNLSMAYSYDFTLSKLIIARTGGSHEINLTYVYQQPPKKKKKYKKLPCPHFYG